MGDTLFHSSSGFEHVRRYLELVLEKLVIVLDLLFLLRHWLFNRVVLQEMGGFVSTRLLFVVALFRHFTQNLAVLII